MVLGQWQVKCTARNSTPELGAAETELFGNKVSVDIGQDQDKIILD